MTKIILFISAFVSLVTSAQTGDVNAVIGISDSLQKWEIRIYKRFEISNCTEVFRMYSFKDSYKAELYQYYHPVIGKVEKPYFTKELLNEGQDNYLSWLKIDMLQIGNLPQMESIRYKLTTKPVIVCDNYGDYVYSVTRSSVSDGISYKLNYKSNGKISSIDYSSPESYLKTYPVIDELELFVELLTTIKEEFDLWTD